MQTVPDRHFDFEGELRRYEVLLQMADLLVCHNDLHGLLTDLAERLHGLISFEIVSLALHEPTQNQMRLFIFEGRDMLPATEEFLVDDSPSGWVWHHQQPLLISDLQLDQRFPKIAPRIRSKGLRSLCLLPVSTAHRRLGALGLASRQSHAYGDEDVRFLKRVAELVAVAADNVLNRGALDCEKARLQMLLQVNASLVSKLDLQESFPAIAEFIGMVVRHDYASLAVYDEARQRLQRYACHGTYSAGLADLSADVPLKDSCPGQVFLARDARVFNRQDLVGLHPALVAHIEGIQRFCSIPLITPKGAVGTLNFASKDENAFANQDLGLLKQIAAQIAIALDNARAYRQIEELKDRLAEETLYLQGEIRSELNFEEIIGESTVLKRVLDQVKTVAGSAATVLILGETGTGKELIARAIHRMSLRQEGSFIKLNCAAIPTGLLESELFGHEKGAFTGAVSQKIGRLELADKGTLFLDEIGDIPLELQPKLLRVLQDQEFERLGGTRTLRVDVRVIAATNQDLAQSVADKEFRSDLYYRLNVFPVRMPALRERNGDISLLVRYFVQKFSRRMNKRIDTVPPEILEALANWSWPGNVRELENFLERSVILTEGRVLNAPMAELRAPANDANGNCTLESLERGHILRVLRETGGVIAGNHGAAARLGLKRTTLQSRMQRMGISREDYQV